MAGNIDVVILDPLVSFHECDESNIVFDRIVKRLNKICKAQNCNIEILHHTRKTPLGKRRLPLMTRAAAALLSMRGVRAAFSIG